jgi:atypical dual specificity phosphatase
VVCLTESHEISERYPQYVTWLDQHRGDRALWFPIPDLHAPRQAVAEEFLHRLDGLLAAGSQIIMHCAAGIGRSGTMAAAVLIWGGTPADSALKIVAAARPMAGPEAGPQRDFLADIARSAGRTTGGPTLQI